MVTARSPSSLTCWRAGGRRLVTFEPAAGATLEKFSESKQPRAPVRDSHSSTKRNSGLDPETWRPGGSWSRRHRVGRSRCRAGGSCRSGHFEMTEHPLQNIDLTDVGSLRTLLRCRNCSGYRRSFEDIHRRLVMRKVDIIRAWKDEAYRASLTEEERAQLPPNPAGVAEINDDYLRGATAGGRPVCCWSACCSILCSDTCCSGICP